MNNCDGCVYHHKSRCIAHEGATLPPDCPKLVDKLAALDTPRVKVINLTLTNCVGCPYVDELERSVRCAQTGRTLCQNTMADVVAMSKEPIPNWCLLEDLK